jgi:enoyl-CoA hydratase/carnithine racemase
LSSTENAAMTRVTEEECMADDKILIERRGRIAIVTMNDPATRNALTPPVVGGLCDFLAKANADASLGCIVLAAAGKGFCSGGNVKDMLEGNDPMFVGKPHEMAEGYRAGAQMLTKLFAALDVPVVAAVQGPAIGAGCDLACMADIRVASPDAKFAESFLRVGLVSGDGGAWLLPRVIGLPRALEMALTCRLLNAEEAKEWGLVTHIVEADKLLDKALELAETIAGFPPVSTRLNKRLILMSQNMSLHECLELSSTFQAAVQSTADQKEAVAALLEKRAPNFIGG